VKDVAEATLLTIKQWDKVCLSSRGHSSHIHQDMELVQFRKMGEMKKQKTRSDDSGVFLGGGLGGGEEPFATITTEATGMTRGKPTHQHHLIIRPFRHKKDKSAGEKVVDKVKDVKDKVVAAVTGEGHATQKKEKKEKAPKPQKAPAATAPLSPALIDLRVGHILKAIKHPEADSLFVSTIAMGDKAGTEDTSEFEGQVVRTVCSGLNGLVPLEEMQGRKVIVVCNLKPVKMRGVKSCAMVLAASPRLKEGEEDNHAGPVELVNPPPDAKAGERVYFEGWKGEPEGILNPKKKVWEMIQPGFLTTPDLEVAFDAGIVKELSKEGEEPKIGVGKLVTESGGVCKVKSLSGALIR